jgi:hypothetical protein
MVMYGSSMPHSAYLIEHTLEKIISMGIKEVILAQGSPSLLWKALGVSLMLLGAAMIAAAIVISIGTSGLGILPGVGI